MWDSKMPFQKATASFGSLHLGNFTRQNLSQKLKLDLFQWSSGKVGLELWIYFSASTACIPSHVTFIDSELNCSQGKWLRLDGVNSLSYFLKKKGERWNKRRLRSQPRRQRTPACPVFTCAALKSPHAHSHQKKNEQSKSVTLLQSTRKPTL